MRKIAFILISIFLSANINSVSADTFSTMCSSYGGTLVSNMILVKFYGFYDTVGIEYFTPGASANNQYRRSLISRNVTSNTLKDSDFSDNLFNILRDALKSHQLLDMCIDSNGDFFALQESDSDEMVE